MAGVLLFSVFISARLDLLSLSRCINMEINSLKIALVTQQAASHQYISLGVKES